MVVDQAWIQYLETFLTENRKELYQKVISERTNHFAVVLEDLYQKHNWSAVVRSCDIFGIQNVYTIENRYRAHISNGVGRGAQKWVNFYRFQQELDNTDACISELKKQGYQIIVTTPHNESTFVNDFEIEKKAAFVFGVEGEGVSDKMMQHADGYLKIPMYGFTESLNVSVAAAIVLQNVVTKLKSSDVNWQLSPTEKEVLYQSWLEGSVNSVDLIKERFYQNKKP